MVWLAAGIGSRWTGGAGVVKGLHPFAQFAGKHRSFIELHLAKSRLTSELFKCPVPHVFTTGYRTHEPLEKHLVSVGNFGFTGPQQCMHPVGHWYEIPNMLRNGLLHKMLTERPSLKYLLLHNIDTLGANLNPLVLSKHIESGACFSFEVVGRRIEDRGGGLAVVDGKRRLLEGMAMPNEHDEFGLTFYSSMTTWIDIDQLLMTFRLDRAKLGNSEWVDQSVRAMAAKLPTYITIKDVKKRWGLGQEDVFPVTQFEKL